MKLSFERSVRGRYSSLLPECDVPRIVPSEKHARACAPALPELSETDVSRHYSALARRTHGVNSGFYPLGSCTMKYNPRIDEEIASDPRFTSVHPLAPQSSTAGCEKVLTLAEEYLKEICGMDAFTFQPAAGAHGEFTGLLLIKAYHTSRNDTKRDKIIVPDSAHGTNPASAAMAGYTVISIPSRSDGCVDTDALKAVVGDDTAGLMLTNPNTLGLFDKNILTITDIVHDAGGLCYYDGANFNAILGVARPGDMGFDVVHLNLHKTFATPHGGGGPGSGPVGCKKLLSGFIPGNSELRVRSFNGNFLVAVKALAYIVTLGAKGLKEASETAVLNANYLMKKLENVYDVAHKRVCMHEFVLTLEKLKHETGVSALDVAKSLIDRGIHPPTMYFPLIVHEALMLEPTETESKESLDEAAEIFIGVYNKAHEDPSAMHMAPMCAAIRRPDEVKAARQPVVKYPE